MRLLVMSLLKKDNLQHLPSLFASSCRLEAADYLFVFFHCSFFQVVSLLQLVQMTQHVDCLISELIRRSACIHMTTSSVVLRQWPSQRVADYC